MIACAVQGCKHQDIRENPDFILRRVSPKGTPFVGMCEEHYVEYVESVERGIESSEDV